MTDHLSKEQLLRFIDGELPLGQSYRASAHLESCWSCRSALDRLEGDISLILDAETKAFEPLLPSPPKAWVSLAPRLQQERVSSSGIWHRILHLPMPSIRPATGYATAVLIAVLIVLLIWLPITPVSAKEIVQQVAIADQKRMTVLPHQVLRQKLRVRKTVPRTSTVRTATLESWRSSRSVYWNAGQDAIDNELLEICNSIGLGKALPLSAAAIEQLAESPSWQSKAQRVSDGALGLTFTPLAKPGSVDLRSIDFRVLPQGWRVQGLTLALDDATFQLEQEELSAIDQSQVSPSILAALEIPVSPGVVPSAISAHVTLPTRAMVPNLDNTEVDVRYELHRIGADLGENIEVSHTARAVVVDAWGVSADRKAQLQALLGATPHVDLRLASPENVSGATPRRTRVLSAPALSDVQRKRDERLQKYFGAADVEENFSSDVLEINSDLLSHLYALESLSERWPKQLDGRLSPSERAKLSIMIEEHRQQVRADLNRLSADFQPLFEAFNVPRATSASASGALSWQASSSEALASARRLDQLARALLTTSDTVISIDEGLPEIREQLGIVDQLLPAMALSRRSQENISEK